MKRTKVLLATLGAAAAVLLAGCSSAGTPVAASTPVVPPTTQSTDAGTPTSESSQQSTTESSSESTSESTESSNEAPPTGGADETTTAWFTAYCEGLKPIFDEQKKMGDLSSKISEDPANAGKVIGAIFSNMGNAFTDTAAKVKDLPVPTVIGGAEMATAVVPVLESTGKRLTDVGEKFSGADVSELAGLMGELSTLASDLQNATGSVAKAGPAVVQAFAATPACKSMTG